MSTLRFDYNFDSGDVGSSWINSDGAVLTSNPNEVIDGPYSLKLDSRSGAANLRMNNTVFGTTNTWVAFRMKFKLPLGSLTGNPPLVRVQNDNPLSSGGGGHFDCWVNATNNVLSCDLMPTEFIKFDELPIEANKTYLLEGVVAFNSNADGTSYSKVRLNGIEKAFSSTLATNTYKVRTISFGSAVTLDGFFVADELSFIFSDQPLDYIGGGKMLTVNDLFYRWLSSVLPASVVSGSSDSTPGSGLVSFVKESVTGYGSLLGDNTASGKPIVTIPAGSLPAGKYQIDVYHYVQAAATPALADNVELRKGSTVMAKIQHQAAVMNSVAYGYNPKMSLVLDLNGSTAVSVNFSANFGASETQTHNAQLVATRIA